jgi:hypothetical protein
MSAPETVTTRAALVDRHAVLEFEEDWEGALATMTPDGFYEWFPSGLRVSGANTITEMWKRLGRLPCFAVAAVTSGTIHVWSAAESIVHCADWSFEAEDGSSPVARLYAVFRFEGALIANETLYTDTVCTSYVDAALGGDFLELTGVERI